jgi:uncharacterized damage-inducible protein DinB
MNESVINSDVFLAHWQGHRRLTRRVLAAFPEGELFTFSIGGMRPFSAMAFELIDIAGAGVQGVATGVWANVERHETDKGPRTREELLRLWDATTETINAVWPAIPTTRFQAEDVAFGQYPGRVHDFLLYFVDNEIHHRAQGFVYLRALGIEPPGFYDRD